jgi:hypothetical protein
MVIGIDLKMKIVSQLCVFRNPSHLHLLHVNWIHDCIKSTHMHLAGIVSNGFMFRHLVKDSGTIALRIASDLHLCYLNRALNWTEFNESFVAVALSGSTCISVIVPRIILCVMWTWCTSTSFWSNYSQGTIIAFARRERLWDPHPWISLVGSIGCWCDKALN